MPLGAPIIHIGSFDVPLFEALHWRYAHSRPKPIGGFLCAAVL